MRHTIGVPMLVCATMFTLIVSGWMLIPTGDNKELGLETRRNLEHLSAQLEAHFLTRLTISEHVRREIVIGHDFGKHKFLSEAQSIHELFRDLQAFNWIDPEGIIRWIYPMKGNEPAQNINVRSLEIPGAILRDAETTGELRVTPPIELKQGGKGFLVYIPVFRKETLLGFLNIVFRVEPLLLSIFEPDFLQEFDVRILDGENLVYESAAAPAVIKNGQLSHTITIGDRRWTVSIAPTAAHVMAHGSIIDKLVLAFLLILTMAISYLIHLSMVRQNRLHTSEKLFRTFIEFTPSAIFIKDMQGRYMHANSKWHEWINPERRDIIGKTILDLFPGDPSKREYVQKAQEVEDRVVREAIPIKYETSSPRADGTMVTALLQKFPIFNDRGEMIAIGGINTDVSAIKKTEETLRHALMKAEEACLSKSRFLATMSHELRTPLNAIIGFSEILIGEYFGPVGNKKYTEYVKDINHSGLHLLTLIDEVLDISAIELGKRDLVLEPLAVEDLLTDCVNAVTQRADTKGIQVMLETEPALPVINADETAMRQIFLNLLANAIKFSFAGGEIMVTARADEDKVTVTVADTGEGIRQDQLSSVTEPFVKGHSNSNITHEGVGLGLSIVKSFVTAHKGTLRIESELGKGTTVITTFPQGRGRMVA